MESLQTIFNYRHMRFSKFCHTAPKTNKRVPRDFSRLLQKPDTSGSRDSFKLLQRADSRDAQDSFKLPQKPRTSGGRVLFKLLKKTHTNGPRDSFKILQGQYPERFSRFFQRTAKTKQKYKQVVLEFLSNQQTTPKTRQKKPQTIFKGRYWRFSSYFPMISKTKVEGFP